MESQTDRMKLFFIFVIIIFLNPFSEIHSQTFIQKFDGINFNVNGNSSFAPFNGGQNNARYQFVDIDGDHDFDLFTFDNDTTLYFYENRGTPQSPEYKLVSTQFQNLYFKSWFYFVDIDNDEDLDLFTGGESQSIKVFRNTGNIGSPVFSIITEELRTFSDTVIYSESNCVPVFCDIDNDGDKDFFTGQSLGTVIYYENIGTPESFSYRFVTEMWQNLLIISPAFENRHGANSLEFTDIDGDNDFDLFWGDLFSKGIYFIQNNGTPASPDVAIVDSIYPHNSPYISQGFNSTRFTDIDADGDKDLFVSVLYSSQNNNNFAYYKNFGTATVPFFQKISDNYLNNVDVGGNSNVVSVDIDNDNDQDLIIGNDIPAKLALFMNTGSANNPSYTLSLDSIPIRSSPNNYTYAPAFTDIDNDGDKDLFLGSFIKDSLWFFRNTGTAENYIFTYSGTGRQNGLDSMGQSSTPVFADIDNDNDKDLFIGASNGRIFYYENTGNTQNFIFTRRTAFYNSIDVGDAAVPRFFDIDRDGDLDLFIGRQDGRLSYYKNEGSSSVPDFIFQTNEYKGIVNHQNSCPEFADIDNDNDPDLFLGNVKGGLFFYQNDEFSGISENGNLIPDNIILRQNYPNPFNPVTSIEFVIPASQNRSNTGIVTLKIYDLLGEEVKTIVSSKLSQGTYKYSFNATGLSSGIYYYKLQAGNFVQTKKMVLVK